MTKRMKPGPADPHVVEHDHFGHPSTGEGRQDALAGGRRPALRFLCLVVVLLSLLSLLVPAGSCVRWAPSAVMTARADGKEEEGKGEGADRQAGPGTLTEDITDPQNLLGADVGSVRDAIATARSETGVKVKLLYLSNFSRGSNPDAWAQRVLASMNPDPDTVLLAVASQDGKLVVAVSSNSDSWLKDQSTVDTLSQAALGPISDHDPPDWVGSARAMIAAISTARQEYRRHRIVFWGSIGFAVLIAVLIATGAILWRRHRRRHPHRAPSLKHGPPPSKNPFRWHRRPGRESSEGGAASRKGPEPAEGTEAAAVGGAKKKSADVQETSR